MATRIRKRWIFLGLSVVVIAVAAIFGPDQLAKLIHERSVKIVEQACGPRSHIEIGKLSLQLLPGDISWSDVRIEQHVDSTDTTWTYDRSVLISGHVDSVQVKGLSLWRLLVAGTLEVRSVVISGPHLELLVGNRASTPDEPGTKRAKNAVNTIRLDSLVLDSGSLTFRNVQPDKPGLTSRTLHFAGTGLKAELPHRNVPFSLTFSTVNARLSGITASLPPVYDATIGEIVIDHPDSLFRVSDIFLKPRKGPKEYGQVVPFETDLFDLHIDTIDMHGLELSALLNERTLRTGELRLGGAYIEVYRDKSLPDGPSTHKNMPARLLRQLPLRVCIDSVLVQRLTVHYHEKDTVTPEYGEVSFDNINGVAHGICTTDPASAPVIHLVATSTMYERAPVKLDFKTAVFDSTDHFSIHALVGGLPFTVFNQMTNDLLLVRTTAGTIGGIDYTLEADENKAHGRVDVEYDNLAIRISKRDGTRDKDKFKSFLANQLMRSKNLRASGNFRHGDFAIDRIKDRQIFNYLWRGLREGMMESILPQALLEVKAATDANKPARQERKKERAEKRKEKAQEKK